MLSLKHEVTSEKQLSIRDIALLTAASAFALSYASSLGPRGYTIAGVHAAAVILLSGLIGIAYRRWYAAMFWGGLTTFLVFLAVIGGDIPPSQSICIGWGAVAAACGAFSGVSNVRSWWPYVLISCVLACTAMTASIYIGEGGISQLAGFDILCAMMIGGALFPTIAYLRWLVDEQKLQRPVLAAWLTLAICMGNFLVPYFK